MIQIDIEMPKTCGQCFCAMRDYDYNTVRCRLKYDLCFDANSRDYSNRRLDGCPLHEITDTDTISRPQWIPCSERLPEEDGDYWVTADPRYVPPGYRSTDVITWCGGKWVMADYFVLDGEGRKMPDFKVVELAVPIIAWMPLPEPYAERRTDA